MLLPLDAVCYIMMLFICSLFCVFLEVKKTHEICVRSVPQVDVDSTLSLPPRTSLLVDEPRLCSMLHIVRRW